MNETKRLIKEIEKHGDKSDQFRQQLREFKEFKEELVKAGVYREDKFTIPLMNRLGHMHTVAAPVKKPEFRSSSSFTTDNLTFPSIYPAVKV